ncbi:MAG: DUF4302 domain-containing protein [Muribaculaceae bacterium]|nr:DUF4302 domain-containing protein [Muribaculaceae bacterium]
MKKFIYLSVMLLTSVAFSSCDNEEDDIFDASAAERLEQYKVQYSDILTSNGGKWLMEYFANTGEQGYAFVMTFNADGSVRIAGNNKWIGGYKSEVSLWEMISDNGPVLTFNSYNTVFHTFSTPENIVGGPTSDIDGSDIDETGTGHAGDYEFMMMGATDESGNTVRLKGKKRGYTILMHRLAADTDDEALLAGYAAAPTKMFHEKIFPLYMTDETGERFVVTQSDGIFTFYPEAGDPVTQTVSYNALISPDGIRFMNTIEIPRANDGVFTVQTFKLDDKQQLVSTDASSRAEINAGSLSELYVRKSYKWAVSTDEADCGESMTALIASLKSDLKREVNQTFRSMSLYYDAQNETYALSVETNRGTYNFYGEVVTVGDDTVRFVFPSEDGTVKGNSNAVKFFSRIPSFKTALDMLNASDYKVSPESVLNPSVAQLVSTAGAAGFFTVKLK